MLLLACFTIKYVRPSVCPYVRSFVRLFTHLLTHSSVHLLARSLAPWLCADHDHVLMDSVADLVGVLAKAWGAAFAPVFQEFLPAILEFAKGSRPATDRSMVRYW